MRATIRQVSEHAGVSVGTVSNVLNSPSVVHPRTRARVVRSIEALGFRPNRAARTLQSRHTLLIGYRMSAETNATLDVFLHSLVERAAEDDRELVLFVPRAGQAEVDVYREMIRRGDVDGFVLSDTSYRDPRIDYLIGARFPFVAFGRSLTTRPFSWIDVDGAAGIAEAVRHLLTLGHRRIGFLGWPDGSVSGDERRRGFLDAMSAGGLPADLMVESESGIEPARRAAGRLLDGGATAIVAVEDLLAVAAGREARARGLRIGPELALVGFDDGPLAELHDPPLSSLRQPVRRIGALLVEELVRRTEDRGRAPRARLIEPELIVRASSGFPKQAQQRRRAK